jgi:hypothetical protein
MVASGMLPKSETQSPAAEPQVCWNALFARLRGRMENRLWRSLRRGTTAGMPRGFAYLYQKVVARSGAGAAAF